MDCLGIFTPTLLATHPLLLPPTAVLFLRPQTEVASKKNRARLSSLWKKRKTNVLEDIAAILTTMLGVQLALGEVLIGPEKTCSPLLLVYVRISHCLDRSHPCLQLSRRSCAGPSMTDENTRRNNASNCDCSEALAEGPEEIAGILFHYIRCIYYGEDVKLGEADLKGLMAGWLIICVIYGAQLLTKWYRRAGTNSLFDTLRDLLIVSRGYVEYCCRLGYADMIDDGAL